VSASEDERFDLIIIAVATRQLDTVAAIADRLGRMFHPL
jgi:hypothetical protein